ncbi:carbamoylphosphate synthase large subunit [bacterium]|nr:carbamoylphosphate synthase large subunit [bacterium]
MNFVFISPYFPENYWNFCDRLHANGVNVLGIGDAPFDSLPARLKSALTEYYRVSNMENYDEMVRAMGFFTFKYGKIDWVESNNEYWLEQDARLRSDFNITTGIKAEEIAKFKHKSVMKEYYRAAGVPTARWHLADTLEKSLKFAKTVGWPIVAKPDNGVGANNTYKICSREELAAFFDENGAAAAGYMLEEFVDGEVVTFDGVADGNARPIYAASHVTPDSIMDIAHGEKPLWYYVDPTISPELRRAGEATLRAFGACNRFFHCEFFRLKTGKPGLGKAGEILGLEVNMRPAGGYTVDMLNYAGGLDLYQVWADMVTFGEARHPLARYHRCCCCTSRRDSIGYAVSHAQILEKYRQQINAAPRLPEVLAREMGDQLYIACFEDAGAMAAFREDVQRRA